jgi:hypothetical protein
MRIELLGNLTDESNRGINGWVVIRTEVERHPRTSDLQKFVNVHATTIERVGLADYHHWNLDQIYRPERPATDSLTTVWAPAEAASFVFTAYSALDSLAQELNLAYKFGIDENRAKAHHGKWHGNSPQRDCVRCALNGVGDSITTFLNQEFSSDWFDFLRRLRNRITHRQLLAVNINLLVGSSKISIEISPDPDGTVFALQSQSGLEINRFCAETRAAIANVLDQTYTMLVPRIGQI